MHRRYEAMTLPELVEQLEDLDGRRTPIGWTPDDAVQRASVERCILAAINAPAGSSEGALRCWLDVRMRSKEQSVGAVVRQIGPGGLLVECGGDWIVGTHVELQVRANDSDEHGLRARGIVSAIEPGGVRVSVAEQPSEAHERRLHRFVLEVIRHRLHN